MICSYASESAGRSRRGEEMKMTKAVTILAVVFMVGCRSAPEGYTVIRNRLRVSETPISFPTDTNVLRFAVRKGSWESEVRLQDVVVRKGLLTFQGNDGSISFTTNNSILVRRQGQTDTTFPMRFQDVRFHLCEKHVMTFQDAIEPHFKEEWLKQNGTNVYWNFSPKLIAVFSNDYWLVDIPFDKSPDFDGDTGRLTVIPNWYDGPKWMR